MAQDAVEVVHLDVGFQFDLLFAGQGAAGGGGQRSHPLGALLQCGVLRSSDAVLFHDAAVGQQAGGQLLFLSAGGVPCGSQFSSRFP